MKAYLFRGIILSKAIFFFAVPARLIGQPVKIGLPITHHYSPKEYGAGIQNWDVAQDYRGVIYFGNNFGLLEFDGRDWTIYPVKNGTKVRAVAASPDGKIYVGCQGDFGYFTPDTRGDLSYISLADSLPEAHRNFDETWRVFRGQGAIYFCTFKSIFIYENEEFKIINAENTLEISFYINENLFVQELDKGLMSLGNQNLEKVDQSEIFNRNKIAAIIPFNGNEMWIATSNGAVYLYNGLEFTPWKTSLKGMLEKALVNTALRLSDGNIAIGTQNSGLIIATPNGKPLRYLNKGKGLISRAVLSLYEDKHGNLWAGQNNGISYIELNSPFNLVNEQMLPGTGYAAYIANNRLYLGTNNGVFFTNLEGGSSDFQSVPNTSGQVYHISQKKGQLLLGHHRGAFSIKEQTVIPISNVTGAWTFLPLKDLRDYMIEGYYRGLLLYHWENGNWVFKHKLHGLDESSRVMEQDDQGYIWMTHGYKGVYRISVAEDLDSLREVRYYNSNNGFPSDVLINVFKIKNRLVFAAESGIYRYDSDTDSFIEDNFFNNIFGEHAGVRIMQEDMFGNIYFIADNSLGVIKFNNLGEYVVETNLFNKTNGMLNDDLPNITILDHQNILIGAKEGFIHYNPTLQKRHDDPFNVLIKRVETITKGSESILNGYIEDEGHGAPVIPYKQNSLRFSGAAVFYEDPPHNEYQFLLENFENDWSDWGTNSVKEYTNLPPGNYIFRVRAKNIYGTLSNQAVFGFSIDYAWHNSPLAYTAYFIIGVTVFVLSLLVLDKKHKKEKQLMTIQKQKELSKKDDELESFAKETKAKITSLRNEKLQNEIKHKNKELASATMHLMNKNRFMTGVKNNLQSLIKDRPNAGQTGALKDIVKEINRNIDHDGDWKQFEFHFDQVHGDFTRRLTDKYPDLTPQELRLCAYLRLNLSTKEIAQLLNVSTRGVEIGRYRLRKKLHLNRKVNLAEHILNF